MTMSAEAAYLSLGRLIAEMPPGLSYEAVTKEMRQWCGRAIALVEAVGQPIDLVGIKASVSLLGGMVTREKAAQDIAILLEHLLARMELKLPVQAQGAFIPAGGSFDAFHAVGKATSVAAADVLMVDPYADERIITEFATLIPERVSVRILSDAKTHKPSLKPAAEKWIQQFKGLRPLEVRLAAAGSLHDRLILVDSKAAWVLGQSFKDLAARSHTSLVRMDSETAGLKITAYSTMWAAATILA